MTVMQQFGAVELTEELEGWPAGTRGTVLHATREASLIEITERPRPDGTLVRNLFDDLLRAPNRLLRIVNQRR